MAVKGVVVVVDSFIDIDAFAEAVAAAGVDVEVVCSVEPIAGPEIIALLIGPETTLAPDALAALPNLRMLAATSAGYNHLPVEVAHDRRITVTRAVDYCTEEVAEHAIAGVCALLRSVRPLDSAVRKGVWSVKSAPPDRIATTVLGLYGYGRIAQALAERAIGLGMTVLAYSRTPRDAAGVEFVREGELLARSRVVSLHVPLTHETRGLVDTDFLRAMRHGSYLVNVSRGELLDEHAVADALWVGRLAGAALDVLSTEPPSPSNPLLTAPNTYLTPHAAWYSPEVAARLARQCAQNLIAILNGITPAGAVSAPG